MSDAQVEFTYKDGANSSDQVAIRQLAEAGHKAEDIAQALRIKTKCVKAWMPPKGGKGKDAEA